jgi:ABC-type transport system involved in multi-copper enzyme maturation permease subunit
MIDLELALIVAAAVLFTAGCTVLPGLGTLLASLFRRREQLAPAGRPAVLGPLFWYELTRLARRGQQPKLRALYAGVLLIGLLVTYLSEFEEVNPIELVIGGSDRIFPLDRMASFSSRFLATFLFCQLGGIVLVTPVYAGGAVPEDRDRGTLDYLRTSLLSNREIVAALFTARLLFVISLVLTGLPILALTMLFGGVDGGILLEGFVVALMTVLSLGAFSLYLGVRGRGLREVLLWAFAVVGLVAFLGFCCMCIPLLGTTSPFTVTFLLLNPPTTPGGGPFRLWSTEFVLPIFVATHGILASVFTWRATAGIRVPPPAWRAALVRVRKKKPADTTADEKKLQLPLALPERRLRDRPPQRSFRVPRLGAEDPLLWKERYFSGRMPGFERGMLAGCGTAVVVLILFPVGLWLFVAVFELVSRGRDPAEVLNPLAKTVAFAAAVALAPALGLRAAVSVARERQRQTLDALFSLPLSRRDVLRAKWVAQIIWARYWLYGVAGVILAATAFGSVHLAGLLVAAFLLGAFIPFANTLGLWLSVRCQSATRAVTWFVVLMMASFLAPVLLSTLARGAVQVAGSLGTGLEVERFVESFSVPYGAYQALFRWGEFRAGDFQGTSMVMTGPIVAAVYALAGLALWWNAIRQFGREGK